MGELHFAHCMRAAWLFCQSCTRPNITVEWLAFSGIRFQILAQSLQINT